VSEKKMKETFQGKDILVTGGCGSIGSEIVKQLIKYNPKKIRVFDNNESAQFHLSQELNDKSIRYLIGDIRDKERVIRACRGVDYVFHAAALKHVPLCEYNPYEAVRTNVIGTQNLIDACIELHVEKLLSIGTDKSVNPINTMGATKLLAEKLVTSDHGVTKLKTAGVRFGNVLNSNGSVIPIFKKQIKNGGLVTVTSEEMTRFFMSIDEAVGLVLKAMTMMDGMEIFILKMKSLRITDLAQAMIEELYAQYGFKANDIKIKITGSRPGEKNSECLFSKEETIHLKETKDMYILKKPIITPQTTKEYTSTKNYEEYDSANTKLLTLDEIKKQLRRYGIV
jgi:UDP-N-acetylglucosamine 4,6-dehydratase/5-epimerase